VQRELRPLTKPVQRVIAARKEGVVGPIVYGILKVAAMVALPFIVYVRTSVGLYSTGGLSPWLSVFGAAAVTVALVSAYAAWLSRRFKGQGRVRAKSIMQWVALPTAGAWCLYSLLYLSSGNAKSEDVRQYYRSLHPVLRVAVATAILGDGNMVITDMRRVAGDYTRMGLPINDRTKHYEQKNGWVHAVDLRTRGRGQVRNLLLELYFQLMGFQTLRHVGTADHLHVQLPVRP
jgi:hypothetical protein